MMTLVDRQGRLFGRMSLIDLGVVAVLVSLTPLGYYVFRSVTTVEVTRIEPAITSNELPIRLAIFGRNFNRSSRVRVSGQPMEPVWFISHRWLEVTLPQGWLAGAHPVAVTNEGRETGTSVDPLIVTQAIGPEREAMVTCAFRKEDAPLLRIGVRGGRDERGAPTLEIMEVLTGRGRSAERSFEVRDNVVLANVKLMAATSSAPGGAARLAYAGQPLERGKVIILPIGDRTVEAYVLSQPARLHPDPFPAPSEAVR